MSEKEVAKVLLENKAVHLKPEDPFTWTSGIKSPIYCDNRKLISSPEARELVTSEFIKIIKRNFSDAQVIAGTATAGIPWASFIAQYLDLPMVYVRSQSKGHGLENLIEGDFQKGAKIILIEDLISTGKSSIAAAKAVQAQEGNLLCTLAIFTYGFQSSIDAFSKEDLHFQTLTNLDFLTQEAIKLNYIKESDKEMIENWKNHV